MIISNNNNKLNGTYTPKNITKTSISDGQVEIKDKHVYCFSWKTMYLMGVYRNSVGTEIAENIANLNTSPIIVYKNGTINAYDTNGNPVALSYQHTYIRFMVRSNDYSSFTLITIDL